MTSPKKVVYSPIHENAAVYEELYKIYHTLHVAFSTESLTGSLSNLMKDLIAIRSAARRGAADA